MKEKFKDVSVAEGADMIIEHVSEPMPTTLGRVVVKVRGKLDDVEREALRVDRCVLLQPRRLDKGATWPIVGFGVDAGEVTVYVSPTGRNLPVPGDAAILRVERRRVIGSEPNVMNMPRHAGDLVTRYDAQQEMAAIHATWIARLTALRDRLRMHAMALDGEAERVRAAAGGLENYDLAIGLASYLGRASEAYNAVREIETLLAGVEKS